jgi:hypothetical protein
MADRALAVQGMNVNVAAMGQTVLVVGVAGYVVELINCILLTNGAVQVTFEDANGTDRMGPMSMQNNGILPLSASLPGWIRTASGQGLAINLSAAVQVGGSITYRLVPDHQQY